MIKVNEARIKTENSLKEKAKDDLKAIYTEIDKECAKGSYELLFRGIISKEAMAALKQEGYKIKYFSGEFDDYGNCYDGYFKISWRRKKNWKIIVKNLLQLI